MTFYKHDIAKIYEYTPEKEKEVSDFFVVAKGLVGSDIAMARALLSQDYPYLETINRRRYNSKEFEDISYLTQLIVAGLVDGLRSNLNLSSFANSFNEKHLLDRAEVLVKHIMRFEGDLRSQVGDLLGTVTPEDDIALLSQALEGLKNLSLADN